MFLLIPVIIASCQNSQSVIKDNVTIDVSTYQDSTGVKASAMPEIKPGSKLMPYKRRFEYLLMNVSEIHSPDKAEERNEIWKLYPDTTELKKRYLSKFAEDEKLVSYFEETVGYIQNPNRTPTTSFTRNELMEVASKFFYCDKVMPDTIVQAHVCIGLNGIKEANWNKDYTLIAAFCFEGIFNNLDQDTSLVWNSFVSQKKESAQKYSDQISSLDEYLEKVKLDVFERMKNNEILKKELLAYYELNKNNLAFRIEN